MRDGGFTLVEMMTVLAVTAVLVFVVGTAAMRIFESSALAVSAANVRSLAAGAQSYLADNNHRFWRYREDVGAGDPGAPGPGVRWWWGFESTASLNAGEGSRHFDAGLGPLGGYGPKGIRPDPSFSIHGRAFKPKYRNGYLGIGYNVLLGGSGFLSPRKKNPPSAVSYWDLPHPAKIVVFATSAQVNNFQSPASVSHPMIEEFYGLDQRETTVHFNHGNTAMVGFADGSCGFLPMDESTRDDRLKNANVGRFAPVGNFLYLK